MSNINLPKEGALLLPTSFPDLENLVVEKATEFLIQLPKDFSKPFFINEDSCLFVFSETKTVFLLTNATCKFEEAFDQRVALVIDTGFTYYRYKEGQTIGLKNCFSIRENRHYLLTKKMLENPFSQNMFVIKVDKTGFDAHQTSYLSLCFSDGKDTKSNIPIIISELNLPVGFFL